MSPTRHFHTHNSPYNGVITQEHFLFYELRITAGLLASGYTDDEAIEHLVAENLYQYPTNRTLRKIARACVRRLRGLSDDSLVEALTTLSYEPAKQICLYAMMKQNRLVCEFMLTVIGEKYRTQDFTFDKVDMNSFFFRLQEQDDKVAAWSDNTITKIKQVLKNLLFENGYLNRFHQSILQPVLLYPMLETAIRNNGDEYMLPAFNQFT